MKDIIQTDKRFTIVPSGIFFSSDKKEKVFGAFCDNKRIPRPPHITLIQKVIVSISLFSAKNLKEVLHAVPWKNVYKRVSKYIYYLP